MVALIGLSAVIENLTTIRFGIDTLILVVDDEPLIRALLNRSLEAEGYMASVAIEGSDALRQLEQQEFDLVS